MKKLIRRIKKYHIFDDILEEISFGFSIFLSIFTSLIIIPFSVGLFYEKYMTVAFIISVILMSSILTYIEFTDAYSKIIKEIYEEICALRLVGLTPDDDYETFFQNCSLDTKLTINGMEVLLEVKVEEECDLYYGQGEVVKYIYQPCILEVYSNYGWICKTTSYIKITKDMLADKSLLIEQVIKENIDRIKESIDEKNKSLTKVKEIEEFMKGVKL